ncbi:MAG: hypothetical protein ACJASR_001685 [Psychroserpens sp.]|jgi:hypothetical protein
MDSKTIYIEKKGSLTIEIEPKGSPIIIFGMFFFYVVPFCIITFFGVYIWSMDDFPLNILVSIPLVFTSISFILIRVFLKKLFEKEIIIVESNNITLITRFIIDSNKRLIKKTEIEDLRYVGPEEFTNHPLDKKGFDYLGIGTAEKEVQWFSESGNVSFFYNGSIFRFGKNIWHESGNEIIEKLKEYGC